MEIFPTLPEDLTTLSDNELQALRQQYADVAAAIEAGDELYTDVPRDELNAAIAQAATDVAAIDTELSSRSEQDEQNSEALASIMGGDPDNPDNPDDPPAEPDAEPAPDDATPATGDESGEETAAAEADQADVAASGARQRQQRRTVPPPARRGANDPREADAQMPHAEVVAAGGLRGFEAGQQLGNPMDVSEAFVDAIRHNPAGGEGRRQVVVASVMAPQPEERHLHEGDTRENSEKVEAVIGRPRMRELTAAGGLCAPLTPRYELEVFGVTDRPVRDVLPRFQAERGGIRFASPLSIADVTTGVWQRTAAQDAAGYVSGGGPTPDKTSQRVPCPTFNDVVIGIQGETIIAGNLLNRVFPEAVRAFQDLVAVAYARTAEVKLLDRIKATSKAAAQPPAQQLGLVDYAAFVIRQAAAYRSRHRLARTTRLVHLYPDWLQDAWSIDQIRGNRYVERGLDALLAQANITASSYLDSATGSGQIMAAQDVTAISSEWVDFPLVAEGFLFADGAYLYIDGGRIDLGVIIDSQLAKVNDIEFFAEEFFEVAFTGNEALNFTVPVCPSGASSAAKDFNCALDDKA